MRSIIQIPSPGFHNRGRLVSLNGELAGHPAPRARPVRTCSCRAWTLPEAPPSSTEDQQLPRQSTTAWARRRGQRLVRLWLGLILGKDHFAF